ncbi:CU044_2847 family protein [Streptomyces chartreusis]|uniref:CU044_2847 family protein n=1 Tax=Streptomyces chartreusis TaxID=1969 RepID=UPI0036596D70
MDGLIEFKTKDGIAVTFDGHDDTGAPGSRLVARDDAVRSFEASLDGVRAAAASALRVFRDGVLRPNGVEIEFGVRMSAEAGAIIAKGTAEGHLVVKLTWSASAQPPQPTASSDTATAAISPNSPETGITS